MKNITDFIIESNFDANSKVRMGDSATLAKFLKDEIDMFSPPMIVMFLSIEIGFTI